MYVDRSYLNLPDILFFIKSMFRIISHLIEITMILFNFEWQGSKLFKIWALHLCDKECARNARLLVAIVWFPKKDFIFILYIL